MSYIAQKKIAMAAKALVQKDGLAKVSVTTIMTAAKMRRQTFYDYFQDKYDVLAWLYHDEVSQIIEDNLTYEHWRKVLYHLCCYFDHNRTFYQQVFANHDQNAPQQAIEAHTQQLLKRIISDMSAKEQITMTAAYQQSLVHFLANALVEEIKSWIQNEQPLPIAAEAEFVSQTCEDLINGLLMRLTAKSASPSPLMAFGN